VERSGPDGSGLEGTGEDWNGEDWIGIKKGKIMSILIDRGLLDQYPIDVAVLVKGDVIDIPTIERITGTAHGTTEYNFQIMSLRSFIERKSRDNGGRLISRNRHGALEILTDENAAKYTERHAKLGRRRFYRNHRRQLDVETKNLSDKARFEHEQSIILNGRMIANMHSSREIPRPEPHKAAIPLFNKDSA
jgi:hypothetical protein